MTLLIGCQLLLVHFSTNHTSWKYKQVLYLRKAWSTFFFKMAEHLNIAYGYCGLFGVIFVHKTYMNIIYAHTSSCVNTKSTKSRHTLGYHIEYYNFVTIVSEGVGASRVVFPGNGYFWSGNCSTPLLKNNKLPINNFNWTLSGIIFRLVAFFACSIFFLYKLHNWRRSFDIVLTS